MPNYAGRWLKGDPTDIVETDAQSPRRRNARAPRLGLYLSAAICAVFVVRALGAPWTGHFGAVWSDATDPVRGFFAVAHRGPFHPDFYDAYKPVGYPLLA